MSKSVLAQESLDREYLPVRAKILEIAASLDRIQRGNTAAEDDARWGQLRMAVELLLSQDAGRAERVQLLFSRPYDSGWREQ